jgi:1,4-dihydroxy-2-naphthoate octaprenyltransferase
MWPTMFEFPLTALAVILCSCAVKLTDDFLDQEHDLSGGRANWAARLGPGTMVYALLLLALAASINTRISLSLYFASYIIGMFTDLGRILPSRLSGWQESVLVMIIGIILFDLRTMIFSLLFITAVQLIDDCIDIHSDRLCGQRNFACRLGVLECWLLAITALLAAWWIDEHLFAPVLTGAAIFYWTILHFQEVRE